MKKLLLATAVTAALLGLAEQPRNHRARRPWPSWSTAPPISGRAAEAGVKKAQGPSCPTTRSVFKYPEQSSAAIQTRIMDDLVAAGVAGIMVSAVDPKTMGGRAEPRRRPGRPVHHRQRRAPTASASPISARSNVDAGKQAGQLMLKALPNGGKCMGFVGLPGADNARASASRAWKETIKGSKIELVDVRADDIDQTRAKRNVEDTITARPEINCMVGFYSYNTPRIYEALKDAGKLGKVTIIGFDEDADHPRRRQGRHHRRHRRAAALRMGLPGHEGHGEVPPRATSRSSPPTS